MTTGVPEFATMDAVQRWVLGLLVDATPAAPRSMPTLEALGVCFRLTDPRARRIASPARRWSEALAVGEFAWHVSGSDDASAIAHYAPRWMDFAEDGRIRGSCYGKRIFGDEGGAPSQWRRAADLLRADPDTRRAVLEVQQDRAEALDPATPDVACVTACQFLLRDGRLHAVLTMRSNDAVWGLPYDAFLFTMLQEMMACELGTGLGHYTHFAGSLHLYERHLALARRILAEAPASAAPMPAMDGLGGLPVFLKLERDLRRGRAAGIRPAGFWDELSEPLRRQSARREAQRESPASVTTSPADA